MRFLLTKERLLKNKKGTKSLRFIFIKDTQICKNIGQTEWLLELNLTDETYLFKLHLTPAKCKVNATIISPTNITLNDNQNQIEDDDK